MFELAATNYASKQELHGDLLSQLRALLDGERDPIAKAANMASLIFHTMPDLNWSGFYFLKSSGELVLGPFHGKPACVRIAVGRGVCGTAVDRRASVRVEDVHDFPGHIACDAASRSELVVPLIYDGRILGVLDLDSPIPGRFDEEDQRCVEVLVAAYMEGCDWSQWIASFPI